MSGKTDVIQQIYEVATDCAKPNWDGYGADPVRDGAADLVVRILESLPDGVPLPEVAAENDGEMALDWLVERGRTLSVSTSEVGTRLPYAWRCDGKTGLGVADFDGTFPDKLLAIIERLYAHAGRGGGE